MVEKRKSLGRLLFTVSKSYWVKVLRQPAEVDNDIQTKVGCTKASGRGVTTEPICGYAA